MTRRPANPFGKPFKQPKAEDWPAQRRMDWEAIILAALRGPTCIEYMCDGDRLWRTMQPYVLYHSSKEKILVGGWQTDNPNKPGQPDWRNPEVGGLTALRATSATFRPDPTFSDRDERFGHGVLGSVNRR